MHQRPRPDRSDTPPDAGRFVAEVRPLLEANDLPGLVAHLGGRYDPPQIAGLLNSPCPEARKVAALSLALIGRCDCIPALVEHLGEADPTINEMAEHALWSIWFRGGDAAANTLVLRGCDALNEGEAEDAAFYFSAAIARCPDFAEAWNQRAISLYLLGRFDESRRDCERALELMPCHFGAWSGLGHCHAQAGQMHSALDCYRRALTINPHLDGVAETVQSLERPDPRGRADDCGDLGDGGGDELYIASDAARPLSEWLAEDDWQADGEQGA